MEIDPSQNIPADIHAIGFIQDFVPCVGINVNGYVGHSGIQHGVISGADAGSILSSNRVCLSGNIEDGQCFRNFVNEGRRLNLHHSLRKVTEETGSGYRPTALILIEGVDDLRPTAYPVQSGFGTGEFSIQLTKDQSC